MMMVKRKPTSEANPEALLQEIARNHLFLETLEPRNVDSLDFHDHPVWAVRSALEVAFAAGRRAATQPRRDPSTTATTTIRVDYATFPDRFDRNRPDAVAKVIKAALREDGVAAAVSDVISHLKIELPTTQLATASVTLANMRLI